MTCYVTNKERTFGHELKSKDISKTHDQNQQSSRTSLNKHNHKLDIYI